MLKYLCIVVFLAGSLVSTADISTDEGVLVLTQENFEQAVTDNEFVLVEFYAPWCGHCKSLAPEYVKAAQALEESGSGIKLAKVDATVESQLAEDHKVRGYPTLKFFKNGNAIDYSGGRTSDEIVSWLKKKTGPAAKNLASVDEAKAFVDGLQVAVVGFFKDTTSAAAKAFLSAADEVDSVQFGITSEDAVFKDNNIEADSVVLFKKFDEGVAKLDGEISLETVKKFVAMESLALVVDFNHETAKKIFGGDVKTHLLLFVSKEAGQYDLVDSLKDIAKNYRSKILFVTINADDDDHQRILEFFGMKKSEVPAMRIIDMQEDMTKYKPDSEGITVDGVRQFVSDFSEKKLKPSLLTQELPEDWNKNSVYTLVSTNFDEVVFAADKNVLVEFYAPWCGHCKQLVPIYDQLGDHFKDDDSIIIAKMDATANELEHTRVESYPTIKLYKGDDKKGINYNGERTLDGLIKFVESGGESGPVGAPDETEEEDEDDDLPRKDEL